MRRQCAVALPRTTRGKNWSRSTAKAVQTHRRSTLPGLAEGDRILFRSHDSEEESLAPHRYRKPLRGGRLHSGVYDPDIEGANNRSNRQRSKGPLQGRQLAHRPQQPRPRSSESPPAAGAAARRQRQSASPQWQAGRGQRLAHYNLPDPHTGGANRRLAAVAGLDEEPDKIDIDVMQAFIPWEFRVAGVFER
jgi:hypothetical protein